MESAPEFPASAQDESRTSRHTVLCGLDRLAFRILEQLHHYGDRVVVISSDDGDGLRDEAEALGRVIVGDYCEDRVLRAAGVERASAIILAQDDDLTNVHAALAAHEINPDIRIVLRMFNLDFGQQIQSLFRHCIVLSASATAAPAFVAATLYDEDGQRFILGGHSVALRPASTEDSNVILAVADTKPNDEMTLFPTNAGEEALCLIDEGPAIQHQSTDPGHVHPHRSSVRRAPQEAKRTLLNIYTGIDRRLYVVMGVLAVISFISTLVFYSFGHLDLIDALYFTIVVVTTTGFGDINLIDAPLGLKLYGGMLMLTGATSLAVVYALITDTVVRLRFTDTERPFRDLGNHIIVSGLGTVGFRIAERLVHLGANVAAVEVNEHDPFIPTARQLNIPVLIADTRHSSTLETLHVDEATCLVAATDDDIANLQTALNARTLNPNLRIVMRLFDVDFAQRVRRTFHIDACHSVSALVAPAFAAAAAGLPVIATLPVGTHVLVVARLAIADTSAYVGRTIADLECLAECRVIHLQTGASAQWRPSGETHLSGGNEVTVIGTRAGIAEIGRSNWITA